MWALIETQSGRIAEIAAKKFEVAKGLHWMRAPKGAEAGDYLRAGKVVKPGTPTWERVRVRRDRLLAECDWTQLADAPLTADERAQWAAYRQALRDLTKTAADPAAVVWPTPPGGDAA